MANLFVANPVTLRKEGDALISESVEFKRNKEKLFGTVEELTRNGYVSPAARAIASNILSYRDDIDAMERTINQYGKYCLYAANKVNRNENRIIDDIQ